jgi:hypothetical protein
MLKCTDITHNTYLKLKVSGDNGQREVSSSIGSTYFSCSADALSHIAHEVGLDQMRR